MTMNQLTTIQAAPTFTMSEMERVALAIAKGRLFGSEDPNAVLTLCMVAQAEGKHPGLVMQQYHIINGKPAKKAEAMLVDFFAAGGKVVWNTLTDQRVEATFSHPQGGEATIDWTTERATKAGLLGNPTWKKYPRQMLRSRVVSEGVRTVFPGATSGMYVPEEVEDFAPSRSANPPTPTAKRARDLPAIEAPREEPVSEAHATDPAEKFATAYIAKLATLTTMPELDAFVMEKKVKLDELQSKRPDLYDKVSAARSDKVAELASADGFDAVLEAAE
jgi:hypothetical protein